MKLLGKQIFADKSGTVKMIPEEDDDLWVAYNLIAAGDVVTTETTRKVNLAGKNKNPIRVRVELEIRVTATEYDKHSSSLRIRGNNRLVNEYVAAGSFHTLELEIGKDFTLKKKSWDPERLKGLEDGRSGPGGCDLAVVLLEEGLAYLYLIGKNGSKRHEKIEQRLNPKTGLDKFFKSVFDAFTKQIDFNAVRCAVIGGSGTIKAEFRRYLLSEAQRTKLKSIENNKSSIVLVNARSLSEVLNDKKVIDLIKNTKVAVEIKAMRDLTEMMLSDSSRACYGPKSVEAAHEMRAVETLMITDEVFRNADSGLRRKYEGLLESVKEAGGKVVVVSSVDLCGEELAKLTGIAAVLRFPLPEVLEDI